MPLILPNQALVLNAYAVLVDETPGNVNLEAHIDFIEANGVATYRSTLDGIFAATPTASLAATMLANLGLASIFTQAEAEAYLNANASNRVGAMLDLANALYYYSGSDSAILAAQTAYVGVVDSSYAYSILPDNAIGAELDSFNGTTFSLTTGQNNLTGTALADQFNAFIFDNQNTFQSGDVLNGGDGVDTLFADIGDSQNFAITGHTTSIERAIFRVQAQEVDSGDNNVAGVGVIDAQRMQGVQIWEDSNSRADLIVEDVRIQDNEITKDITIVMRDTDPGHVDYGVYFDQNSLRNVTDSTSVMTLRVLDTHNTNLGNDPLQDSPYGSFTFWASVDGADYVQITLASAEMQAATTFDELVAAMQAAADAKLGVGAVVVSLGSDYVVPDSVSGNDVTGTAILVTANADVAFDTTRPGSGWLATEVVPAISGLYTSFGAAATAATDLVTSTIVLDNVGRGSTGGDLVVGGLSVGDTSDSKGVQQFDITVEDSSRLQTINSTNNTLQVVNIVNGTADEQADAYRDPSEGNLTVNGTVGAVTGKNDNLPGTADQHDSGYGFSDVRVIDASAMTGKFEFTAELTEDAVDKYLDLVDDQANPAGDNIDVIYSGGTNDDSMTVDIDDAAVASHSNINVGREDFTFVFNGNAGDDEIDVAIDRSAAVLTGGTQAWYQNQAINANITINAGAGDDTIRTPGAGNIKINGEDGNDTVYADNTGRQAAIAALDDVGAATVVSSNAVFVFNTDVQGADDATAQNLYNLVSDPRETVGSYGIKLTVNYRGLTATVNLADTADYKLSDLEVNQAIKDAVNNDDVLSKLLVAEDGPSGTLVVTSLIDGVHATADLGISFSAADTALSDTIRAAYNTANGTALANAAALAAAIDANIATMALNYVTQTADDTGGVEIVGANSVTSSDNVITGGAGDDVLVLGTTGDGLGADGNNFTAFSGNTLATTNNADSNDTVVLSGVFGNDVIVNFTADLDVTAGEFSRGTDKINVKAYMGTAAMTLEGVGAGLTIAANAELADVAAAGEVGAGVNSEIVVRLIDSTGTADTADRNDSAASVKLQYTDDATADNGLYITFNALTNVATLYQVVDGTSTSDLAVTLVGTVDLADTVFTTLRLDNFA